LLLAGAIIWGIFGTIYTTVEGQGVLMRQGGAIPVTMPCKGVVSDIVARAGQMVEAGQELAHVKSTQSGNPKTIPVVSPCSGRILQRVAHEGGQVEAGATLLLLERLDEPLLARLFLPTADGYRVDPDKVVHIMPTHLHTSDYGYLIGRVLSVDRFPMTQADMMQRLHNEELVRQLAARGPCLQILVALETDPNSSSGYRWSSPKGAQMERELYSGTPCEGHIILGKKRLIHLVFPGLGAR
jgi:pyruvate/2-oxoglutarate dehydrogenase complex dihydrolipoamide acyltransferase (E2) component